MRCWCGYLSGARCRLFAYGPADAYCLCQPETPSSLASFKSRLVLPFWYQLIQVALEKRLNGCSCGSKIIQQTLLRDVNNRTNCRCVLHATNVIYKVQVISQKCMCCVHLYAFKTLRISIRNKYGQVTLTVQRFTFLKCTADE